MKIVSSVDNRAYAIVALDNLQPGEDSAAQLRIGETACAFDIENGRQVAWLQFDMTNEEAGLFLDINIRDEEMICSANDVGLTRLAEILVETLVNDTGTLGGLDEDETQRAIHNPCIAQAVEINTFLIVRDINTANLVVVRINGVAIGCRCWMRGAQIDEVRHKKRIASYGQTNEYINNPRRHSPQEFAGVPTGS